MEDVRLTALHDEKKSVKNEIQSWIAEFASLNGRQPHKEEKATAIKPLYERYRSLQQSISDSAQHATQPAALTAREMSPSHTRRVPLKDYDKPNSARDATPARAEAEPSSSNWIPSLFGRTPDEASDRIDELESENEQLKKQLEQLESKYSTLEDTQKEAADVLNKLQQEAETSAEELSELRSQAALHADATREHSTVQASLQETIDELHKQMSVSKESQVLAQLAVVNGELSAAQNKMLEARAECKAARDSLKLRTAELAAAVERANNHELTAAQDSVQAEKQRAEAAAAEAQGELQSERDAKAALIQQLTASATHIAQMEAEMQQVKRKEEELEELKLKEAQALVPEVALKVEPGESVESAQMRRRIANLEYALGKAIQWNKACR